MRLSLFGSAARGEQEPASDVDLLEVFENSRKIALLDVIHIQNQIAGLLGLSVDLVEEGTLKPRIKERVEHEAVRAF